jgi:uncharacterized protein
MCGVLGVSFHPINEFIVKVASRCNLNCDYCYEYNLGDNSWKRQPKLMDMETVRALGRRIAEHASSHAVPSVFVALHGGEPLLLGSQRLDEVCRALKEEIAGATQLFLTMQTNATLIDGDIVQIVKAHQIAVSISLDGDAESNDRHRVDHQGRGSHARVIDGIATLRAGAPECFSGLLAVMDLRNDPIRAFDALAAFGVECIDFLLPHHHWDRLPPRVETDSVAYGRWYWEVYKAWTADRHPRVTVRFLANIVSQLAGGGAVYEAMTLTPCTLVTIATDGSIEAVDCVKSTASGLHQIGMNVRRSSFDHAVRAKLVSVRQSGAEQLAPECLACDFKSTCAGGYFPHRWGRGRGFDNPSVYCDDLFWLVTRIREDLVRRTKRDETVFDRQA